MAVIHASDFAGVSDNGLQWLLQCDVELQQLKAAVNQLISDMNGHVHGGITTGASNSAGAATSAVAVVAGETTGTDVAPPPS